MRKFKIYMTIATVCFFTVFAGKMNIVNCAEYDEMAVYSTKYNSGSINRTYNLKRASDLINWVVVAPGETFSFNATVGPASKRQGFLLAEIFVRGRKEQGYGGGICQVSSTLYNAADEAGLTIVERHSHSRRVGYVAKGRDATTSYGGYDFKFRNDNDFPVVIGSQAGKNRLTIRILEMGE